MKFVISIVGTFETRRPALKMSVHRVDQKWLSGDQNDAIGTVRTSSSARMFASCRYCCKSQKLHRSEFLVKP